MSHLITHFFEGATREQCDAIMGSTENPTAPPEERTAEVTNQVRT